MEASGISRGDVVDLIMDATDCLRQKNGRYRIDGDLMGRATRVIVDGRFEPEVVIVSAHWIGGRGT